MIGMVHWMIAGLALVQEQAYEWGWGAPRQVPLAR